MQYTICSQCGSTITSKHRFCGTCGFPQKQRNAFRITRKWSFVILACLILATGIGWRIWISTTYQPASCKILSFTENSIHHRSKHGSYTTYQPAFTALVTTHNGQQEEAISYDGPYRSDYSSYDEAQQIGSAYQVGQTYPCWYSPYAFPQTALDLHSYSFWDDFGACLQTILISFLWLFCAVGCIAGTIHTQQLRVRGVTVEGRVTRQEERRGRRGRRYTVSIIAYRAIHQPDANYEIEKRAALPIGSTYAVTYDALNPQGNVRAGQRPGTGLVIGNLIAALIFLGISATLAWSIWTNLGWF